MRRSTLFLLFPMAIALLGLALTGFLVASDRGQVAAESADVEAGNRAYVRSVANNADDLLAGLSERLRVAADSLSVASAETVDAQIVAQDLLDANSIVQSVCVPGDSGHRCLSASGVVSDGVVPLPVSGLQIIQRGSLRGRLAYGTVQPATSRAGAMFLLDLDQIVSLIRKDLPLRIRIEGFPVADADESELSQAPGSAVDLGNGLSRDEGSGTLTLRRELDFLGTPMQLVVEATDAELVSTTEAKTGWLLFGGLGLTFAMVGFSALSVRALGQLIDERDIADAARERSQQRFRTSFSNAPIGVVEVDAESRIVAVNPRFAGQLGYNVEELDGHELLDLVDGEDRPAARTRLQSLLDGEQVSDQSERRYRGRNGGAVWVRESASVLDLGGGVRHILIQAEDVSDERRSRAELHRKALFDDLTGLPNRANLTARLNRAIEAERASGELLAVMFVDLDKFKEVNDTHGHEAGDQLLVEVAERLRRVSRSSDTVARLGGDEFVVICEGLESDEDAERCASRFAEALRFPMQLGATEVRVQASIGLVVTSGDSSPERILREADQAMYQAKTTGRDRLVRFEVEIEDRLPSIKEERDVSEAELAEALERREFLVHYHPIFDTVDHDRVVGVEALVRWEHPGRGILVPSEFLAAAEKYGLVQAIDEQVLGIGIEALAAWIAVDEAAAEWFVSFNVAGASFEDRSFAASLLEQIDRHGVSAGQIVLERDENGFMRQPAAAVLTTRDLRKAGIRLAIDHFGAGAVSLSEVPTLEFDLLKIDRSFVRDTSLRQRAVLAAMQQMAEALDLVAIVEGVENAEELSAARGAKIAMVQGFHLCRPMDHDAVAMQFLRAPSTLDGG